MQFPTDRVATLVASSLLIPRIPLILVSVKAVRRWSELTFLYYLFGLPMFAVFPPVQPNLHYRVVDPFLIATIWYVSNKLLLTKISYRNLSTLLTRVVPPLLWFAIVHTTHHVESVFEDFLPVRWLLYVGTSWLGATTIVICSVFSTVFPAEAARRWLRFWNIVQVILASTDVVIRIHAKSWLESILEYSGTIGIISRAFALQFAINGLIKYFHGWNSTGWLNLQGILLFILPRIFVNLTEQNKNRDRDALMRSFCPPNLLYWARPHRYRPLNGARQIRLLLLHPRNPDAPIKCSLFHMTLGWAPLFEAVSYTWGNPERVYQIIVDGQTFKIPANAHRLLQDLSSITLPRLIWIDSICINQDDVQEKSQQVALMAEIYSRATLVTVHLGSGEIDMEDILKDMEIINDIEVIKDTGLTDYMTTSYKRSLDMNIPELTRGVKWIMLSHDAIQAFLMIREMRQGVDTLSQGKDMGPNVYEEKSWRWNALTRLLQDPWFERIWVVQEVVLASSARILYHGQEMEWTDFADGIHKVMTTPGRARMLEMTNDPKIRSRELLGKGACLTYMVKWREDHNKPDQKQIPFGELMETTSYFKATDLRDHVFGVQGICPESAEDWTKPDYTLGVERVYINAAIRLINELGIPAVMSLAGLGYSNRTVDSLQSLPSWVPDWSGTSRRSIKEGPVPFGTYGERLDQVAMISYAAGGSSSYPAYISKQEGNSIFLPTVTVGTIVSLGPVMEMPLNSRGQYRVDDTGCLFNIWKETYEVVMDSDLTKNPYPHTPHNGRGEQSLEEAFWRVLVGDRNEDKRPAPAAVEIGYQTWVHNVSSSADNADYVRNIRVTEMSREEATELHGLHTFVPCMMQAWSGRRVGVTSSGHIGLFPRFSAVGNVVMVVPQAQSLFVLKRLPVGDSEGAKAKFRLIGESYLHGAMDGECLRPTIHEDVIEVI